MECCANKITCDGGPTFISALCQKFRMKDKEVTMKDVEDHDKQPECIQRTGAAAPQIKI
jgi:hypothetical protein